MKNEQPTAFEIAQLAAMIAPAAIERKEQAEAVQRALKLYRESESALLKEADAAGQLKILLDGIFTMTAEEWQARVQDYKGTPADLEEALSSKEYPAAEVHRKVFKDKNLTPETREKLFIGLGVFAANNNFPPPRKITVKNGKPLNLTEQILRRKLNRPTHDGHLVRWAVEARQLQLAKAKSRIS